MKKIITFFLMSIMATVLMTGSTFATNGMRMIGFGPVQNSMGGVSVGLPLDAAAVLTNPAGMSILPGRIDFGASYFVPSVEYKATESAGMGVLRSIMTEQRLNRIAADHLSLLSD